MVGFLWGMRLAMACAIWQHQSIQSRNWIIAIMIRDIRQLDLDLLKALDTLLTEGSATRAAARLNLTQPAVSSMLGEAVAMLTPTQFNAPGRHGACPQAARRRRTDRGPEPDEPPDHRHPMPMLRRAHEHYRDLCPLVSAPPAANRQLSLGAPPLGSQEALEPGFAFRLRRGAARAG